MGGPSFITWAHNNMSLPSKEWMKDDKNVTAFYSIRNLTAVTTEWFRQVDVDVLTYNLTAE